jgi:hypothetical protein
MSVTNYATVTVGSPEVQPLRINYIPTSYAQARPVSAAYVMKQEKETLHSSTDEILCSKQVEDIPTEKENHSKAPTLTKKHSKRQGPLRKTEQNSQQHHYSARAAPKWCAAVFILEFILKMLPPQKKTTCHYVRHTPKLRTHRHRTFGSSSLDLLTSTT